MANPDEVTHMTKHVDINTLRATVFFAEAAMPLRELSRLAAEEAEELARANAVAYALNLCDKAAEGWEAISSETLFSYARMAKHRSRWALANRIWHVLAGRALRGREGLSFLAFGGGPEDRNWFGSDYYNVLSVTDGVNKIGIPNPTLDESILDAIYEVGYEGAYSDDGYDA